MEPKLALVLTLLASPLLTFALNVLAHQAMRLLGRRIVAQKTVFFSAIAANAPVLAAAWWFALRHVESPVEAAFGWLFAFCLHNAFGCFYYQCFSLSETSLHIHALCEVYLGRAPEEKAPAPKADAAPEVEDDEAVAVRLDRLVDLGQARKEGDRYLLTGSIFLYVSKLFDFWRWLVGCGRSWERN